MQNDRKRGADEAGNSNSISPYGAIEFLEEATQEELNTLKRNLRKSGMDLLDVHESKLVHQIINSIKEVIHCFDELPKLTYPDIITKKLLGEANESVLKIFSEVVGMSVIQFIVIQKVERINPTWLSPAKNLQFFREFCPITVHK